MIGEGHARPGTSGKPQDERLFLQAIFDRKPTLEDLLESSVTGFGLYLSECLNASTL